MYKIGLTGGIGSGKSTAARLFEKIGVPVYYSDLRAKELMLTKEVSDRIRAEFGEECYDLSGALQREYLSRMVFSDPRKLALLNSIVHPAVAADFRVWASGQSSGYVIQEAAILIESGACRDVDEIIVVTAPEELRVERVMKRDGSSQEDIRRRVSAQMTDLQRAKYADYTIIADESQLIMPQILKIDSEIQKKIVPLCAKL